MNYKKIIGLSMIGVVLLIGFNLFLVNPMLKSVVSKELRAVFQTKVSVGSTYISLNPLGITITDLTLVDSDNPSHFKFKSPKLKVSLQVLELLKGRYIIDELTILEAKTAHKKSVVSNQVSQQSVNTNHDDSLIHESNHDHEASIINDSWLRDFLANHHLSGEAHSVTLLEQLVLDETELANDRLFESNQDALQVMTDSLTFIKESLHKTDLKGLDLLAQDMTGLTEKASQLKQLALSKKDQIKSHYDTRKESIRGLTAFFDHDYEQLKQTIQLETYDSKELSDIVLNNTVSSYLKDYLYYSKLASRVIYNLAFFNEGLETKEHTHRKSLDAYANQTMPRVWIKQLVLLNPDTSLSVRVFNLSSNQSFVGKPVRFQLHDGKKQVFVSYFVKKTLTQVYSVKYEPFKLNDYSIYHDSDHPVMLDSATQDIQANVEIIGRRLSGNVYFNTTRMAVANHDVTDLSVSNLVYDSLKNVDNVLIEARLSGTTTSPSVVVSSEFDRVVADRFKHAMTLEKEKQIDLLKQSISLRMSLEQSMLLSKLEQLYGPLFDQSYVDIGRIEGVMDSIQLVNQEVMAVKDTLVALRQEALDNQKRDEALALEKKQRDAQLALEKAKKEAAIALEKEKQDGEQSLDYHKPDAAVNEDQYNQDVSLELSQNL